MKKSWFDIQAKQSGPVEIYIYDEIGAFGIRADLFIEALKSRGDVDEIALHINSPGGDPFSAAAMYLALKRHAAKVTAYNDGLVASAASIVLMAGDWIVAPENTLLMIHDPIGGVFGTAEDMRSFADSMDKIKQTILTAYRRSGKTDEELAAIMSAETWYNASEALENKFIDEISNEIQVAAFFDVKKFAHPPEALLQRPTPEPAPTLPAPEPVDIESIRAQVRAEIAAEHVTAVADARAEAIEGEKQRAADDVKRIVALCFQACVPDIAQKFISEGRTVAWVEDRLKHAGAIKARCAAARMFNRAAGYITANLTPEEVTDNLMQIKLAMDGPEIDGHLSPESYFGNSTPGQPTRPKMMTAAQIYEIRARYNKKEKPGDELIAALAIKVKESLR